MSPSLAQPSDRAILTGRHCLQPLKYEFKVLVKVRRPLQCFHFDSDVNNQLKIVTSHRRALGSTQPRKRAKKVDFSTENIDRIPQELVGIVTIGRSDWQSNNAFTLECPMEETIVQRRLNPVDSDVLDRADGWTVGIKRSIDF